MNHALLVAPILIPLCSLLLAIILRRHLLAFSLAQSRHGGAGALYALLKRKRET